MHQLNFLQNVKLEELVLDGNPVCDKFKDQNIYVRYVMHAVYLLVPVNKMDELLSAYFNTKVWFIRISLLVVNWVSS